jgi:predicted PurR-regulated permease PerM
MHRLENNFFIAVLLAASAALVWIALPYFGAILWGVIAAILFSPVNQRLLEMMPARRNTAALLTLLVILSLVIIPAMILGALLVQEATVIYGQLRGGHIDFVSIFEKVQGILPNWAVKILDRVGLMEFDDIRNRLAASLADSFQTVAAQALTIGQSTLSFFVTAGVALYLAFFLLRDGKLLAMKVHQAVPLPDDILIALRDKFITVTRATINGSMVVAIVQGVIGGVIFWILGIPGALLWGVTMAFFSLIPSIGTGLIWVPVSIYLFASNAIWQGATLVFCGVAIIGMVDNVLRPILVGRDTRIPDYIVLLSTLGGLATFGFNGIIIGPVIAAVFLSVWEIFASSQAHDELLIDEAPPSP